jgi:hypothetical protein
MSKEPTIAFDSDELLPCACGSPTYILENSGYTIMSMLRCKCGRKVTGLLKEHVHYWNMAAQWNKHFLPSGD